MADSDYARLQASCGRCGVSFSGRKNKVFCGQRCKKRDWQDRTGYKPPAPKVCSYWAGHCARCGKAHGARRPWAQCPQCVADRARESNRVAAIDAAKALHRARAKVTQCGGCGVEFCSIYGAGNTRFCPCCASARDKAHRRAQKAKRRAVERGLEAQSIDPLVVFDRDHWRCQLCGVKTPKTARGGYSDNAPELDHILPLSKGGAHRYDNVQCACRKCNLEKSDRPLGQMLLIG